MKQTKSHHRAFHLRATSFGPVAVFWSLSGGIPKITQILISPPELSAPQALESLFPDTGGSTCREIEAFADQIEAFLNGADIRFSLDMLRLDLCRPFQRRVLYADHAIPRGCVSTYRLIAEHVENPRAARAVGTAMATNPFPLVIPCHRLIRSDGTLGGYGGGLEMKRKLLAMEGVAFRDDGRVAAGSIWIS
jgi:methylated-DNA-[protein]-cysteine S-methyltransferase